MKLTPPVELALTRRDIVRGIDVAGPEQPLGARLDHFVSLYRQAAEHYLRYSSSRARRLLSTCIQSCSVSPPHRARGANPPASTAPAARDAPRVSVPNSVRYLP